MQWISVEKELPEECENVLIWSKGMCVTGAYRMARVKPPSLGVGI